MTQPTTQASYSPGFRPDIQGLRAVAVLLVVVFHAGFDGLPGGYVGVDVFFVISGYLITGLLLKEQQRDGRIQLLAFYARRIRRLLPAANLVLLVTLFVAWLLYSPLELKQFTSSAFATALYLSNLWFAHISTDYLAEGVDANPLLHTWSLAAEEQFYLFWPLLILLLLHWAPAVRLRYWLALGMGAVALVSFSASVWLTETIQPWAFFSSPTRAWEFAIGGLLALLPQDRCIAGHWRWLAGVAGAVLIALAATVLSKATQFPGWAALLPVLGAALLLLAAHGGQRVGVSRLLSWRPMQFVGDISYSLYLWHWPVFVFMAMLVPPMGLPQQLAGIGLSLLLAVMTYYGVENPVRFYRPLMPRVLLSVVLGVSVSAAVAGVTLLTREDAKAGLQQPQQQRYQQAATDIPAIYGLNCHLKYSDAEPVECWFGDESAQQTMVLFGDSHAAHWLPALRAVAEQRGWKLLSLTKTGCPSVSFEPFNRQLNRPYHECTQWREQAFRLIEQHRPVVTVMSNYARYRGERSHLTETQAQGWAEATDTSLMRLALSSGQVLLLRDTPALAEDGPRCLSRADWQGRDVRAACQVMALPAAGDRVYAAEQQALMNWPNAHGLDLNSRICPAGACPIDRDGAIVYYDAHHMTTQFSRRLATPLNEQLSIVLGGTP